MNGYQNEYDFVCYLNHKKIKELDPLTREFIDSIFYKIHEEDEIKAWRNHFLQKADILIKIQNVVKGVSIKMGARNSVHVEQISSFISFLKKQEIPSRIIQNYLLYHFGDGSCNNSGTFRKDGEEIKKEYQFEIQEMNRYFNQKKVLMAAIDRFVLKGNNSEYPIDAIIYGTPENFLWLTKLQIIDRLLKNKNEDCSAPHFGN